jgi:hypothetical protein
MPARLSNFCCRTHFVRRDVRLRQNSMLNIPTAFVTSHELTWREDSVSPTLVTKLLQLAEGCCFRRGFSCAVNWLLTSRNEYAQNRHSIWKPAVIIVTTLWARQKRNGHPINGRRKVCFPSAQRSDQPLGPGVLYKGVIRLGRQDGRSPPANKETGNRWIYILTRNRWIYISIYTHIFTVRWITDVLLGFLCVYKGNILMFDTNITAIL